MRCTDVGRVVLSMAAATLLVACQPSSRPAPGETRGPLPPTAATPPPPEPAVVLPAPSAPLARAPLPAPGPVRNWAEVRRQAALRLVAANPDITYTGLVPEPLLAIPVLEIELNGDGSVRRIELLRAPGQARDTIQIASDAVRRAAPFGDVSRLPRPWRFTETFLFDNARRFKPRTLD